MQNTECPIQFDISLTPRDMYRFNMYQAYSGFQGWFSIIIAILIFVVAGSTYGSLDLMYTIVYIAFGIIFLFYVPVSLLLRSKHSIAASEVLSHPLHYAFGEKGLTVTQGEANAELPWDQIYRMTATKSNVLIYSNRTNAYVIPKEQLGQHYVELAALANQKLPKYRVKMKQ